MATPEQLAEVFARLRPILESRAGRLVVLADEPGAYTLGVPWVRDDGYRGWFGGVRVGKRYVSFHLMPVYAHPNLLEDLTPALRKRMQGKSCFNFTRVDEKLFAELEALTGRGLDRFAADGLL